jgi:hypothetical protein
MKPGLFLKAFLPVVLGLNAVAATLPIPLPGDDLQLPVSLHEVMVTLVNYAADPIWAATWKSPQTDREWSDLERLASQLEVAGALLTLPGTGPMDKEWAANPQWQAFAIQLRDAGGRALKAIRQRDKVAISAAGDHIVEVCRGCHAVFKPD